MNLLSNNVFKSESVKYKKHAELIMKPTSEPRNENWIKCEH